MSCTGITHSTPAEVAAVSQCNATFDGIAARLGGFTCRDAPAIIHLRSPLALSNWTLPVLEVTIVTGAALALWWAIYRLRRRRDPTLIALWFASIVYLLVTEIPLYFPTLFGIQDSIGVVFDHNVFMVQFLYERLPLYIGALYPALTTLAFEIVRTLGVFRGRRGVLLGGVCVGFVHHCLYEVFDQLGPQLRWWAWNDANPLNHPMFASVPMTSMVIFAALGPGVLTVLVLWLVDRPVARGVDLPAFGVLWRTVVAGTLVPVGVALLSIPSSAFSGRVSAQALVFAAELALLALIAIRVLSQQIRHHAAHDASTFVRVFGPLYLGVLGGLWITALPAYFGSAGSTTADGTPVGSLPYAAACFALSIAWVTMASRVRVTAAPDRSSGVDTRATARPSAPVRAERPPSTG
jgi:hypothetical protein